MRRRSLIKSTQKARGEKVLENIQDARQGPKGILTKEEEKVLEKLTRQKKKVLENIYKARGENVLENTYKARGGKRPREHVQSKRGRSLKLSRKQEEKNLRISKKQEEKVLENI